MASPHGIVVFVCLDHFEVPSVVCILWVARSVVGFGWGLDLCHFACSGKDLCKHDTVQAAGVGVAQGWMVAAEQDKTVWQHILCPMAKLV